jgi:hypothetical protein
VRYMTVGSMLRAGETIAGACVWVFIRDFFNQKFSLVFFCFFVNCCTVNKYALIMPNATPVNICANLNKEKY